ncbi:MAG: bi-domain-containing oxidoreductase [Anaerolineales bacterium]
MERLIAPPRPRVPAHLYAAWRSWADLRFGAVRRLRPVFRGLRVEWSRAGQAWTVPFERVGPARGEVLVRTIASAVSLGTERAFFSREPNAKAAFPFHPGYSLVGEVWHMGKGLQQLHRGQLVATRAPHASLIVSPVEDLFPLPEGVQPEEAAFIRLGIIALHGLWRAELQLGERVAILGRGAIGHLAVQLARALGAGKLISIAPSKARCTPELSRFAHRVIATEEDGQSVLDTVHADITFEVSGSARAICDAVRTTRDGGRVVLLGSPRGKTPDFDFGVLADRGITLLGAHLSTLPMQAAGERHSHRQAGETYLGLLAEGALNVRSLISLEISPWEAGWFYRHLAQGEDPWVGALLRWDSLEDSDRAKRVSYWAKPELEAELGRTMLREPLPKAPFSARNGAAPTEAVPKARAKIPVRKQRLLRVAEIGGGEHGGASCQHIQQAEHAELAIVMDIDETVARRLGERLNVPWTTDYDAVLTDDAVDAVFINTPHHIHADQAIRASLAGKHLIVTKPLAHNLKDAVRIVRAARDAGVHLSVGLSLRYLPQIADAKQLIEEQALGTILGAHLTYHQYKPAHYWQRGYAGNSTDWRSQWDTAGGGVLIMTAIHYFDWILYLSGLKVIEVSARYATLDSPAEVEDSIALWLTFENGAIATVNAATCVQGLKNDIIDCRLWGTEGHISLEPPSQFFSSRLIDGKRPGRWKYLRSASKLHPKVEYLDRFAQAVIEDKPPEITGADGLCLQAIIEAAYRSSRDRCLIPVEYPAV